MSPRPTSHAGPALQRLQVAQADGRLDALCAGHQLRLLVLFGSAARGADDPGDLDLAHLPGSTTNVLAFLDALVVMLQDDRIDLVNLAAAGPTLRHRAMTGIGLYEDDPGLFARTRDLALRQYFDTAFIRRAQAEALSR